METEPLDQALELFATTAPEFGAAGLSNHGPMAAEALVEMGHSDQVAAWTSAYAQQLDPAPAPADRAVGEHDWPKALGVTERFGEWLSFFERELADRPPSAVVGEWVPRLVPGCVAAATHGLIRTAHALRALGRANTPARRVEVAIAMAYWASRYRELPGPPLLIGHQEVDEALADLPYLPEETPDAHLISDRLEHMSDIADEFEQGVASLAPRADPLTLLDRLAVGGAKAYLRNADEGNVVALVHAITAPLSLELVLPWLGQEDWDAAVAYAWQAVAALHVAYAIDRHCAIDEKQPLVLEGELAARAAASGDAHAIKVTEAALRCYARTEEPALVWAAADACDRLGATGR